MATTRFRKSGWPRCSAPRRPPHHFSFCISELEPSPATPRNWCLPSLALSHRSSLFRQTTSSLLVDTATAWHVRPLRSAIQDGLRCGFRLAPLVQQAGRAEHAEHAEHAFSVNATSESIRWNTRLRTEPMAEIPSRIACLDDPVGEHRTRQVARSAGRGKLRPQENSWTGRCQCGWSCSDIGRPSIMQRAVITPWTTSGSGIGSARTGQRAPNLCA